MKEERGQRYVVLGTRINGTWWLEGCGMKKREDVGKELRLAVRANGWWWLHSLSKAGKRLNSESFWIH